MFKSPFHSVTKRTAAGILLVAGIAGMPSVSAQEALEEITVTARKVAESLQEAPLSVVVLTGEAMAQSGISRVEELVSYVPNFAMSETGIGTNLYVRGIGSGINQGFEQSVGLYIDGIYYGRAQLTRAPFMDMAQAEALRGPQAILLGNNSIAGALNFTTAKPTDTLEASVSALYEPDHNEQELNGMISGPIGEWLGGTWGARFAGRYRTMDGYIQNTELSRDEPNREETSARITIAYTGDTIDGTLKLEKNQFDVKGRQIEIIRADPAVTRGSSQTGFSNNTGSSGYWRAGNNYLEFLDVFFDGPAIDPDTFDPDTDYVFDNANMRDGTLNYNRGSNGDKSNNDITSIVGTLNVALGEHTLTATAGHVEYDYVEVCDCDFTSSNLFSLTSTEDYSQNSIELRLASPQEERFRYLAGVYYQADELDFGDQIFLPVDSGVVRLVGYATTGNPEGAFASLGDTSAFRDFDQSTYTSSVFGQVSYDLTERWRASLGVRYSHIEKEAIRILREGDLERNPFNLNDANDFDRLSAGTVLFASIFDVSFHQLSGARTTDNTAFEFVTDFDLTDDILVYGSVKTGFKGGGFDVRSNSEPSPVGSTGAGTLYPADLEGQVNSLVPPGSFEFKDEQALAFEAGTKLSLLNGTAELNIAVFRTNFDDLQVSIFDGTLGFNVGNAAKAITQGVELDGRWAITDDWSMNGSLGYLDFEFDDFPNGQCNQGQAPTSPNGLCDYTGQTNQYVADFSGNLALHYEHPLTEHLLFRSTLDTQFTTAYNPSQNLDPRVEQDAYAIWNLRVALADADEKWEVALLGRNLTDEEVVSYANDTPLAFSQTGAPTFYGFVERSRSVTLQASYRFGD
jgi:outer membrane receptor protein involved in Fe transport